MSLLRQSVEGLARGLSVFGLAAILALLVLIAIDVFGRYVLNSPLLFAEEVSGYLVAAIGFTGAAETLRQRRHIRIEILMNATPQRIRLWLDAAAHLVGLVALIVFVWHATVFLARVFERGTVSPTILATPMWMPQSVMLIGATVFLLQLALSTASAFIGAIGYGKDGRVS